MNSTVFAEKLKEAGLFAQFKQRRAELEADGGSKKDAYNEAASEFESLCNSGSPAPPARVRRRVELPRSAEGEASSDVFKGKQSTLKDDYQWVYENIAVADVEASDAPSSGAWGLLQFARTDSKSFYVEWMRMVGKQVDENAELRGFVQDATRSTAEIAEMLRSLQSSAVLAGGQDDGGEPETEASPY